MASESVASDDGPLLLCFGCRHKFPSNMLAPVDSFGDELSNRFETVRSFLAKLTVATPQSRQNLAALEDELKRLVVATDAALKAKDAIIEKQAVQLRYFAALEENTRSNSGANQNQGQRSARAATSRAPPSISGMYASGLLNRFLQASRTEPVYTKGTLADAESAGRKRRGSGASEDSPRRNLSSAGGGGNHHRAGNGSAAAAGPGTIVAKPSDLVGASIYNIVEAVAARVRAASALLWIHSEHREEVVAPFVCGSGMTRFGGKPLQLSVSSSTPGTVLTTGIAVNVLRPLSATTRGAGTDALTAVQGLSVPTLLLPVYKKYGAVNRDVVAVLQVLAHPAASPFSLSDENDCAHAAYVLSHLLGNYGQYTMDWAARTFDPSVMTRQSCYSLEVDTAKGDPQHPGINALDDGVLALNPPVLIFRSDSNTGKPLTRTTVAGNGEPMTARDLLKDVHRYTSTLEGSWKRGVGQLADYQKKLEDLQRQLDLAKQGINEARRSKGPGGFVTPSALMAASMSLPSPSRSFAPQAPPAAASVKPLNLGMSDVDDLESDVLHRMQENAALPPVSTQATAARKPVKPSGAPAGTSRSSTFITE